MKQTALLSQKPTERRIYIFGPKNLQNELLCRVLGKELVTSTSLLDHLHALAPAEDPPMPQRLLLIDAAGMAPKRIVEEVKNCRLCVANIVAFFNLKHGSGIESDAIKQGLRGFFYENDGLVLLLKGVKILFDGQIWVSRDILVEAVVNGKGRKLHSAQENAGLSAREMEVLALIAAGANNKQIADKLFVSENTVKTHIYNIFKKIKVPNRLQAALWLAHQL